MLENQTDGMRLMVLMADQLILITSVKAFLCDVDDSAYHIYNGPH